MNIITDLPVDIIKPRPPPPRPPPPRQPRPPPLILPDIISNSNSIKITHKNSLSSVIEFPIKKNPKVTSSFFNCKLY